MRKTFLGAFLFVLMSITASSALAQSSDLYKFEFYGGYSYMNLNRGFDADEFNANIGDFPGNRVNAHGIELGVNYNFRRFWGAKFVYTRHAHSQDLQDNFKLEQKVGQFMGGIQIKDNKKDGPKLKPFAHLLFGAAQQSFQGEGVPIIATPTRPEGGEVIAFDINSTDFTMSFGGGLDLKVHKNVDIRLVQFDWNPIFRGDRSTTFGTFPGAMQNNYRFGVGVVLH